jgi:hypothetical protein
MEWISVRDRMPDKKEPVLYMRWQGASDGKHAVGIAYWTVSKTWNPERESANNPGGFTHWAPLPEPPSRL